MSDELGTSAAKRRRLNRLAPLVSGVCYLDEVVAA
jgi:hypothetical protein